MLLRTNHKNVPNTLLQSRKIPTLKLTTEKLFQTAAVLKLSFQFFWLTDFSNGKIELKLRVAEI